MKIIGIEGKTAEELRHEIDRGGKFVFYTYCISILIMTFKRPSSIHFVPGGRSAVLKGLGFTILTFFFGWWGIPWGPIYTIQSFITNFSGGKDVTAEVMQNIGIHS